MNANQILNLKDEEVFKLGKQLRVAYELKRTLRYAGSRDMSVHGESVAEHIFALFFLAQYFLPLEDPKQKLDRIKIYEMLLFHDFGEIPDGDIPYHLKTKDDEETEKKNAKIIFKSLPSPLDKIGQERWSEYEAQQTPEGQFVNALDKIEPVFELLDSVSEKSLKRTKFTYRMHLEKKLKAIEGFPIMRKFVNVLSDHMNRRSVFWEESKDSK